MIRIQRFRHVAIVVNDLDAMVRFYSQTLGFEVKRHFGIDSDDFSKGVGIVDAAARGAHLVIPGGDVELELFKFEAPASAAQVARAQPNDRGYRHLAFVVGDLRATYAELVAQGIEFVSEPVLVREPKQVAGLQFVYFRDPEGNIVELNQLP